MFCLFVINIHIMMTLINNGIIKIFLDCYFHISEETEIPMRMFLFSNTDGQCYYKGKTYKQGASWDDGCDYQCTCMDGVSGKYQCYNK